jgi:hypothetical protein
MLLPQIFQKKKRAEKELAGLGKGLHLTHDFLKVAATFVLVTIAWIFFRADSIFAALSYLQGMLSPSLFSVPDIQLREILVLVVIVLFTTVEWLQRNRQHGLDLDGHALPRAVRWAIYAILVALIVVVPDEQQKFIYFQF